MLQDRVRDNIRVFLERLPKSMSSIVLFDKASKVVGFALVDTDDSSRLAEIYNLDCKKVKDIVHDTTIKEMIDLLLKDKCSYIK